MFMVRRTEAAAGPPVAAVRLSPKGIPGTFSVTDRDMMLGGPWPDQVWLNARVDTDGNPTTKQGQDLISETVGPFEAGSNNIVLTLKPSTTAQTEESSNDSAERVRGTIQIAEGTSLSDTSAVFIIVRRTETPAGPPVAAVRMTPSEVPGTFSIGDSHIMMGGPWPDQVWVQVRADSDGNAMTKDDKDISSQIIGPITSGTSDVVFTLGG